MTVLGTRRARPGCEAAFEVFLARLQRVFAASPGNLGMTFVPPCGAGGEYLVTYQVCAASIRASAADSMTCLACASSSLRTS